MPLSVLEAIPPVVLAGLALGGLFSLFAAALFVAGERLFPNASDDTGTHTAGQTDTSEDRRRGEIRQYLQAIGERYIENDTVDGQQVAFYLPERDVAITFDAHVFFRIQNLSGIHAVLCEHEMPGSRIGDRLPFETPSVALEPTPADPVANAYAVLGLSQPASSEAVRSAYREQIKQAHPDHGGDEESFREIQEAYATAKEDAHSPSSTS